MGDSIDNIKGVPGIGEKGARDLIATYGTLEALLAHAAEVSNKRLSRRPARITPTTRDRAASWRASGPTCRWTSSPNRCATAAHRSERCFELFSRLGFRSLVMEFAPTAQTVGKDYTVVDTLDGVRALADDLRAAGRFGVRVLPDGAVGDARIDRRPVVLDAHRGRRAYVPFAGAGLRLRREATRRAAPALDDPRGPCSKTRASAKSVTT